MTIKCNWMCDAGVEMMKGGANVEMTVTVV